MKYTFKFWQIILRVEWDEATLIDIFYISLKNYIKNEIAKGDRSNELFNMIKIIICIDNHVYKW
jgi:hypothetical protein